MMMMMIKSENNWKLRLKEVALLVRINTNISIYTNTGDCLRFFLSKTSSP